MGRVQEAQERKYSEPLVGLGVPRKIEVPPVLRFTVEVDHNDL